VNLATAAGAPPAVTVSTAADGTYDFDRIAANVPWIVSTSDHASGFARMTHPEAITLEAGETRTLDLTMKRWGRVNVRVLDALTRRPAGVSSVVSFTPRIPSAVTQRAIGPGGVVSISLPEGDYAISTLLADYEPFHYPGFISVLPETTTDVEILVVPRGARITGRVVDDRTGQVIVGIPVIVERTLGRLDMGTVITDIEGVYMTRPTLPPGTYAVRTNATSAYAPAEVIVTVGTREIATGVDLRLRRIQAPAQ
jgi:hypothetical protein